MNIALHLHVSGVSFVWLAGQPLVVTLDDPETDDVPLTAIGACCLLSADPGSPVTEQAGPCCIVRISRAVLNLTRSDAASVTRCHCAGDDKSRWRSKLGGAAEGVGPHFSRHDGEDHL